MTIAGSDPAPAPASRPTSRPSPPSASTARPSSPPSPPRTPTSVLAIAEVPEEVVIHQIDGVLEDIGTDAVKTGMLSSASIIEVVADRLEAWGITNVVVDPVMVAKSGDALLQPNAVRSLVKQLLPLALVVTPNIPEAEVLARGTIETDDDAERGGPDHRRSWGPATSSIKGGHRGGDDAIDLVFDGIPFERLSAPWIETANTHGTGCTFSAAIAAYLARVSRRPTRSPTPSSILTAALVQSLLDRRRSLAGQPLPRMFAD